MERTATKITITGRCLGQSDGNGWEFQEPPNVLINDRGIRNLASLLDKFEGQRVRVVITPTKGRGSHAGRHAASGQGAGVASRGNGGLNLKTLDGADLLQAFVGMPVEISAELLDVAIVKTEAPVVTGNFWMTGGGGEGAGRVCGPQEGRGRGAGEGRGGEGGGVNAKKKKRAAPKFEAGDRVRHVRTHRGAGTVLREYQSEGYKPGRRSAGSIEGLELPCRTWI